MSTINSPSHSNSPSMVENSNRFNSINVIQSNRPKQQLNSGRHAYIADHRPNRINHALAVDLSSLSGISLALKFRIQRWFSGGELQNLSAQPLWSRRSAEKISRLPTIWESPEEN